MKKLKSITPILLFLVVANFCQTAYAQINTGVVVLNEQEQSLFREQLSSDKTVAVMYESIKSRADSYLKLKPNPIDTIFYEGLLDNNPKRVESVKSLLDANKVVDMIYAGYGSDSESYGKNIKAIVLAWSSRYHPTGNPINENKLTPLFWGYHVYKKLFDSQERVQVEEWMTAIAMKELNRKSTPNNNWQSKRLKIIGIVGCITENEALKQFALEGIKTYISTSYFPDGSSLDFKTRDALHYHSSGIEPLLDIFINLHSFDTRFNLYAYKTKAGTSVSKVIDFIEPYLSGEKTHAEWVNTTIQLDKERAAAGLKKYQPGKLYDPKEAVPMLNWAVYYEPFMFKYICDCTDCYKCNFEAFLNSPLIR